MRFVLIFTPIMIAAASQLILKAGMDQVGEFNLLKSLTNPLVLLGLSGYGVSAVLWMLVLTRESLSFVYPLVAFSYVLTVLMARFILHEPVPVLRWLGLGVIVTGILLVAKSA